MELSSFQAPLLYIKHFHKSTKTFKLCYNVFICWQMLKFVNIKKTALEKTVWKKLTASKKLLYKLSLFEKQYLYQRQGKNCCGAILAFWRGLSAHAEKTVFGLRA